jgi:hypothetical protein
MSVFLLVQLATIKKLLIVTAAILLVSLVPMATRPISALLATVHLYFKQTNAFPNAAPDFTTIPNPMNAAHVFLNVLIALARRPTNVLLVSVTIFFSTTPVSRNALFTTPTIIPIKYATLAMAHVPNALDLPKVNALYAILQISSNKVTKNLINHKKKKKKKYFI